MDPSRINEEAELSDVLARSALLLIDLQNDYLHPNGLVHRRGFVPDEPERRTSFLAAARGLLTAMRSAGRPIVWLRTELSADYVDCGFSPEMANLGLGAEAGFLVRGSWGAEFIEGLSPAEEDFVLTKTGHSPFQFTYLDRLLANLGVSSVVLVAGGVYDGLPETGRQAGMLGYEVVVPTDCIAYGHLKGRGPSAAQATVTTAGEIESLLTSLEASPDEKPLRALLLVDIQNDFYHPEGFHARYSRNREVSQAAIDAKKLFVESNVRLLDAAHAAGAPVIFIGTHARPDNMDRAWSKSIRRNSPVPPDEFYLPMGSWGAKFMSPIEPKDGDFIVMKRGQSGFGMTHLHRLMRNLGVTSCLVTGGGSHACVEHTIRDGVGLGYDFTLVNEAISGAINREVYASHADVIDTEEALQALGRENAD
jgi:ureidoacrylate peracid hydrolase